MLFLIYIPVCLCYYPGGDIDSFGKFSLLLVPLLILISTCNLLLGNWSFDFYEDFADTASSLIYIIPVNVVMVDKFFNKYSFVSRILILLILIYLCIAFTPFVTGCIRTMLFAGIFIFCFGGFLVVIPYLIWLIYCITVLTKQVLKEYNGKI